MNGVRDVTTDKSLAPAIQVDPETQARLSFPILRSLRNADQALHCKFGISITIDRGIAPGPLSRVGRACGLQAYRIAGAGRTLRHSLKFAGEY